MLNLKGLAKTIEQFGVAVVAIGDGPCDCCDAHAHGDGHGGPGFAFTVGQCALGLPEIIISGLPSRVSMPVLNIVTTIARARALSGIELPLDQDIPEAFNRYPGRLRTVHPSQAHHLGWACRYWRVEPTRLAAVQLFWPDRYGFWPWDPGWDRGAPMQQHRLDLPGTPLTPSN